jgi:hypothetical protein
MRRLIPLLKLFGKPIEARLVIVIASWVVWILLALVAYLFFDIDRTQAIFAGFGLVFLHWVSVLLHEFGYQFAGRRIGYPIEAIQIRHLFGTTLYPEGDTELPGWGHLYRGFGAPILSFVFGIFIFIISLFIPEQNIFRWVFLFLAVENILLLGVLCLVQFILSEEYALIYWYRQLSKMGMLPNYTNPFAKIIKQRVTYLFTIADLQIMALRSAFWGSWILWIVFTLVCRWVFDLSVSESIVVGFIGMLLHWLGEFFHNYGHSLAAKRTGFPMKGILGIWIVGMSVYPKDEPEIAPELHIQRALGGPIFSIVSGIVWGLIALYMRPEGGILYGLVAFFALENLFFYGFGAFLPLRFTDGSTILKYRNIQQQNQRSQQS